MDPAPGAVFFFLRLHIHDSSVCAFAHGTQKFAWPPGDALLAERSLEVLASLCEHLTRRAEEGQGFHVLTLDMWDVG